MLARIGSRHLAHLYISGGLRFRLGLFARFFDFPFERRRHDGVIRASDIRSSSRAGSTNRTSLIFAVVTLTGQCSTGRAKSSPRPWFFAGTTVDPRAAVAP